MINFQGGNLQNKTANEIIMKYLGVTIALIALAVIWLMPTPDGLSYNGKLVMGIFVFALILWVCESIPNWVTSLIVIVLLPLTGAWAETETLAVFGYDVIWLMVAAFIIASAMEKSGVARRIALFLICKLGRSTNMVMATLFFANSITAFMIPSTTARGVMVLPITMMVIEVFKVGANGKETKSDKNFAKVLTMQGIHGNALSTGLVVTATSSQVLAVGFIRDLAGVQVTYMDWLVAALPSTVGVLVASFFLGKILFPFENLKGSSEKFKVLTDEYKNLGKISAVEKKSLIILVVTIFLWATDGRHMGMFGFQFSLVMTAILGAVLYSLPRIGILTWKEIKIPWDLMLFSAGAYAGGLALDDSGLASWLLMRLFNGLGVESMGFFTLYAVIIFVAQFSHFFFTSKTIRCIVMLPMIISIADMTGYNPISLALPAALTLCDSITMPMHSKVNLAFYSLGTFSVLDMMKYGFPVLIVKYGILLLCSFTWFRLIGII